MKKIKFCLSAAFALASISSLFSSVSAQDDVFQTGQTTKAYNYVQAVYLFDQGPIEFPVLFNLQYSLHPSFVLKAEYLNLSGTVPITGNDGNPYNVKTTIASTEFGIGYHLTSQRWPQIDWLADVLKSTTKVNSDFTGARPASAPGPLAFSFSSIIVQLGARATITPKIEAQALAVTFYDDGEFNNELLDLTVVYRAFDHIDIAAGSRNATDKERTYNLGLRYNW